MTAAARPPYRSAADAMRAAAPVSDRPPYYPTAAAAALRCAGMVGGKHHLARMLDALRAEAMGGDERP